MQNDARIQGYHPLRCYQERVDIDLLDPPLFDNEKAEIDEVSVPMRSG